MSWKCLASNYIVNTKWLKVRKDRVELPNGHIMDDYYVVEKSNVALIVALDSENRVILKKEYRYPLDTELIELPGGTFEADNDNPLEVAQRELLEETGYKSDDWEHLGTYYDYPTKDTNTIHVFLAKDVYKVAEPNLEISEDISFDFIPLKDAVEMVKRGDIQVCASVTVLLKVYYTSAL